MSITTKGVSSILGHGEVLKMVFNTLTLYATDFTIYILPRFRQMKSSILFPLSTIFLKCLSQDNSFLCNCCHNQCIICFHVVCRYQLFISQSCYSNNNAWSSFAICLSNLPVMLDRLKAGLCQSCCFWYVIDKGQKLYLAIEVNVHQGELGLALKQYQYLFSILNEGVNPFVWLKSWCCSILACPIDVVVQYLVKC